MAPPPARRKIFTVFYCWISKEIALADVVGHDDVARPVVDVGDERPAAIARDRQEARGTETRDEKGQGTDPADATVGEAVELNRVSHARALRRTGCTRHEDDAGIGDVPRAGRH